MTIERLLDARFPRYLLASIGALAVDMGGFLALLTVGMWPAGASALSYGAGIAAHWLMSSRFVFASTVAAGGAARARQKAAFVASALAGLLLTFGIVWAGDASGIDPRLAKIVAIGASFTLTWLLRLRIVFR